MQVRVIVPASSQPHVPPQMGVRKDAIVSVPLLLVPVQAEEQHEQAYQVRSFEKWTLEL